MQNIAHEIVRKAIPTANHKTAIRWKLLLHILVSKDKRVAIFINLIPPNNCVFKNIIFIETPLWCWNPIWTQIPGCTYECALLKFRCSIGSWMESSIPLQGCLRGPAPDFKPSAHASDRCINYRVAPYFSSSGIIKDSARVDRVSISTEEKVE